MSTQVHTSLKDPFGWVAQSERDYHENKKGGVPSTIFIILPGPNQDRETNADRRICAGGPCDQLDERGFSESLEINDEETLFSISMDERREINMGSRSSEDSMYSSDCDLVPLPPQRRSSVPFLGSLNVPIVPVLTTSAGPPQEQELRQLRLARAVIEQLKASWASKQAQDQFVSESAERKFSQRTLSTTNADHSLQSSSVLSYCINLGTEQDLVNTTSTICHSTDGDFDPDDQNDGDHAQNDNDIDFDQTVAASDCGDSCSTTSSLDIAPHKPSRRRSLATVELL